MEKNTPCPAELEGLGKQIATQCRGVPLAVVVIGGMLSGKCVNMRDMWKKVPDSVSNYVHDDKRTEDIISLIYTELPQYLRNCLLYLGIFPENIDIPAWKLTCMWVAEGFIEESL